MSDLAALITAAAAPIAAIAAIGSVAAVVLGVKNRREIQEMQVIINLRLSALIAAAARTGRVEGDARDRAREKRMAGR